MKLPCGPAAHQSAERSTHEVAKLRGKSASRYWTLISNDQMKPYPKCILLLATFVVLAGCSVESNNHDEFQHSVVGPSTPWNGERFDSHPGKFTFAIFSDLTGGERQHVFDVAIAQLSLLRPELILNVGDLIEGESQDPDLLAEEWDEFDDRANRANAPVFYTGGNHDLTGRVQRQVWLERHGRHYYHFIYKDVLFLILDTEDHLPARMEEISEAREAAIAMMAVDPDSASKMEYFQMHERVTGQIGIEQAQYFRSVIEAHSDVRWTFLLMHKPVWLNQDDAEFESIISSVGNQNFTVFNGHLHRYAYEERNGSDFIMLGTTGGAQSRTNPMAFDHVTLVTVAEGKPSIVNLRLDGILDKTGSISMGGDSLCFQASSSLC